MKYIIDNISSLCERIENNGQYIICAPKEYKNLLHLEFNKNPLGYQVKFVTIDELIKKLTFTFDENAIYYLMDKYQFNYDAVISYLNNLFFASIITNNDKKVSFLKEIYDDLLNNNLLIFDDLFKSTLIDKKLIIVGYNKIRSEYLKIFKNYNFDIYSFKEKEKKSIDIYECVNFESELHLILDKISDLILKGISLDKIKIIGINNLERTRLLFSMYNININLNDYNLFTDYPKFNLNNIFDLDIDTLNDEELKIYKQAIDYINQIYIKNPLNKDLETTIINHKLKSLKIKQDKLKNAVELISFDAFIDSYLFNDCYLFICGLNEGIFPNIIKDEDYFKDSIKTNNKIETSYQLNYHNRESLKKLFYNCKKVYVSYSLYDDNLLYPSSIIKEIDHNIIKYESPFSIYSNKYNKLLLVRYLDLLSKYGKKSDGLNELYNTYYLDDYLKYDNKFKIKNKDKFIINLNERLNKKIKLSYSSMNVYNNCPFAYFIENILKVNTFESTFPLFIGNMYHYVLEQVFKNDEGFENVDEYISRYLLDNKNNENGYLITPREEFLLNRLIEELKEVIKVLIEQKQWITYNNMMLEKRITLTKDVSLSNFEGEEEFSGVIDKLYYKEIKEDDKVVTYVSLIDYKTGNTSIKLDLVDYGLSMQLPVYIYLIKESKIFENIRIGGIFIQNILSKDYKTEKSNFLRMQNDYELERLNSLKLDGYLNNDNCNFDLTDNDSQIIKGLKKKKDGSFYHYSKVLSPLEIEILYNKSKKIIDETYQNIINGEFSISPKVIDNKHNSCSFCKYNDLCYKTYKDIIHISLRGDSDA